MDKYKVGDVLETPGDPWYEGVFVVIKVSPERRRPYTMEKVSGRVCELGYQTEDQLDECTLIGTTKDGAISSQSTESFIEWEDD